MRKINRMVETVKNWGCLIYFNIIFIFVLCLIIFRQILNFLIELKIAGKGFRLLGGQLLMKLVDKMIFWMDYDRGGQISRAYLVELALENMRSRSARSIVTIGGVALGVGAIVFLVSVGYGLEKLVISRVAKLNELKMADVSLVKASLSKMNEVAIGKIQTFNGVKEVLPIVSMVAKVKFNNSVLDVMSFGVDARYLQITGVGYLTKEKFKNMDEEAMIPGSEKILGETEEVSFAVNGEKVDKGVVKFNVKQGSNAIIYSEGKNQGKPVGVVIRRENGYIGEEVWGEKYDSQEQVDGKDVYLDQEYSKWMKAKVPLWRMTEDGAAPEVDGIGKQKWAVGYLRLDDLIIDGDSRKLFKAESLTEYLEGIKERSDQVLGINTTLVEDAKVASASALMFAKTTTIDKNGVEWVELNQKEDDKNKVNTIKFQEEAVKEAYISSGMMEMLGLKLEEVGEKMFSVVFIVPDSLLANKQGRAQSEETEYLIKGVIDDDSSNYFYFHLSDARKLGVSNYSQLKILVDKEADLAEARRLTEMMGYKTSSTVDTVVGIEKIFKTLRLVLGLLGTIALAVASLGMFNTMTVSLLERTREVGVMKAMGMQSDEVRELFLAESMMMGVGGGALGVIGGYAGSKLVSIGLSLVSVMKGQATLDLTYLPIFFVIFIMMISFVVGIFTGWYPSKRARAISALNALRYE
ncbi:MAG: ABC transporter permease [Candidatus Shapirobacteria bacterium]|jgi:ABC-type antimicrobial peptide transport system permease subunit